MFVANHRATPTQIQQRYGNAHVLDVISKGVDPWICFSPFYPHGGIHDIENTAKPRSHAALSRRIWETGGRCQAF